MNLQKRKSNESLHNRVVSAGRWVIGGHGATQLLRLGSNLAMTRLLVPEMFGLMAVAWLFMTGLQLISDMGLRQSIIRSDRAEDPVFRGTAWAMQVVRGVLLWLIGVFSAISVYMLQEHHLTPVGSVYDEPLLGPVIGVLSIVALFSGFESTRLPLSERNLSQKVVIRNELVGQLIGIAFMISWAAVQQSIWALVAGGVVSSALRMIFSHFWLPGEPDRFRWDNSVATNLFHFGKWIFLTSTLGFAIGSGDRLLLAGMVSAELLGLYAIAFLIVDTVVQLVSKLQSAVAFPALSEVARDRPGQLRDSYYRFRKIFDVVTLFGCGFLFFTGDVIIDLLFDSRYQGSGNILEILAITLFFVRFGMAEMCCLVLGKPALLSTLMTARGIALYLGTPVLFMAFGFVGAVWAIALHRAFSLLPIFYFKVQNGLLDLRKEILTIPALFVGGGVGYSLTYLLSFL